MPSRSAASACCAASVNASDVLGRLAAGIALALLCLSCAAPVSMVPTATNSTLPPDRISPSPSRFAAAPTAPRATPTLRPTLESIPFTVESITAPIAPRFNPSAVWTGAEVIYWGGVPDLNAGRRGIFRDGAAFNAGTGAWRTIATSPLQPGAGYAAAWSGMEMLLWSGDPPGGGSATVAAYDPARDSWRRIASGPLPQGRATSIWTGSEWIVLSSGANSDATAVAAYNAASDSWRELPNLPEAAGGNPAWTGSELLVSTLSGVYTLVPGAAEWTAPTPRGYAVHGPVSWTGELMIGLHPFENGPGLIGWHPATRMWQDLPAAPFSLADSHPLWTGDSIYFYGSGLLYEAASGTWMRLGSSTGSPRAYSAPVWAGDRLVVWGGGEGHRPDLLTDGFVLIPRP